MAFLPLHAFLEIEFVLRRLLFRERRCQARRNNKRGGAKAD
jgi:hypothetical protein